MFETDNHMNRNHWIWAAAVIAVLDTGLGVAMATSSPSRSHQAMIAESRVVTSPASHTAVTAPGDSRAGATTSSPTNPVTSTPFSTTLAVSCSTSTLTVTVTSQPTVSRGANGSPTGAVVIDWNGDLGDAMSSPLATAGTDMAETSVRVPSGAATAVVNYGGRPGTWAATSASTPTC